MALAALRPCPVPRCPNLTRGGRCDTHKKAQQRADTQRRGTATHRGYDYQWGLASKRHLAMYPLCGMSAPNVYDGWRGECAERGLATPADVTDHIVPHKGDRALFWDARNWQSLCGHCNRLKAIRYEGGFGR